MPRMLIAGSSRGIGAAVARLARTEGWDVVLHGRAPSRALAGLAAELDATAITCDGVDRGAVRAAVEPVIAEGKIDALVNSLGSVIASDVVADEDEPWLEQYAANVLAPLHFAQAVIPAMVADGHGAIVNVSSIRGLTTMADVEVGAYSAAKAALINVTAGLARRFAPHVRANAVAPGFTLTDMADSWSDRVRSTVETALLGRPADPAEIAEAIFFLASPRSSFITGQTLLVDGGFELADH